MTPNENPYSSPMAEPVEGEERLYQKELGELWYQRAILCLGCGFSSVAVSIASGGISYAIWGNREPPPAFMLVYVVSFFASPLCLAAGNVLGLLAPADRGVRGWSVGALVGIGGVILSILAQYHWPIAGLVAVLFCFFAVAICDTYWLNEAATLSNHPTRSIAARVAQGFLTSGFIVSLLAILHAESHIEWTQAAWEQRHAFLIGAACGLSTIGTLTLAVTAFVLLRSLQNEKGSSSATNESSLVR